MGGAYDVFAVIATVAARLLRGIPDLLGLGLDGFNSGLMGLALANFFVRGTALWCRFPVPDAPVALIQATIGAPGATLFAPGPFVGLLFLAGVLASNWHHAVVALIAALLASSLAAFAGAERRFGLFARNSPAAASSPALS